MTRAILGMAILGVLFAVFAALYRDKTCSGNCGACHGTCKATGEHYEER